MASAEDRYVFYVEWFDAQADLIRRYSLTYFARDNTIEMYDQKNRRHFLKRSEYAGVKLSDLYIDAVVTVLARQLRVVEYADVYTRKAMESQKSHTLAIVKPDAYNQIGHLLTAVTGVGFVIARLKMLRMTPAQAEQFCQMQPREGSSTPPGSASHLASDVCVVLELLGDGAISKLQAMVGPGDPSHAQAEAPRSMRALYGTDSVRNAVHASESPAVASAEIDFFFGGAQEWPTTALFNNCTLCVVRPHAFTSAAGEIVSRILSEGFEISAMKVWFMDRATAEEFLEVYKGVMPEYHDMVAELCTGPSLVMEVRQEDATSSLRKLIGPHDPEVAKHLRPGTIRSQFGIDRVKNAVHCTDLPEDGLLEVEYFFNILYGRGGK